MTWLPPTFAAPQRLDLPTGHHLRPVTERDTDIDLPAVMGSRERLWSIYGEAWGWPPATMTWQQDHDDLVHHRLDAERNESFLYGLFPEGEEELLGCVYVDPPVHEGTDAEISWWVVDRLVGTDAEAALDDAVPAWIARAWPFAAPRFGPPT